MYLPKGALHFSKEVCTFQTSRCTVNVMNHELQLLKLFKEIIHNHCSGELGVQAVFYPFCPSNLKKKKQRNHKNMIKTVDSFSVHVMDLTMNCAYCIDLRTWTWHAFRLPLFITAVLLLHTPGYTSVKYQHVFL